MKEETTTRKRRFRILPTGDTKSQFYYGRTAKEVLESLGYPRRLLSTSAKSEKSAKFGVMQRILYLTSGVLCPKASPACLEQCLGHSSGRMSMHAEVRDRKTALFLEDREYFMRLLRTELYQLAIEAKQAGLTPCVRLNGTSDLPWFSEHPELFDEFRSTWFIDYTKVYSYMSRFLNPSKSEGHGLRCFPQNYHLTYSLSENNTRSAHMVLRNGGNVAVVFDRLPKRWQGNDVISGDLHDARFLDPKGVIVGLKAKGAALKDRSGFVVRLKSENSTDSLYGLAV